MYSYHTFLQAIIDTKFQYIVLRTNMYANFRKELFIVFLMIVLFYDAL